MSLLKKPSKGYVSFSQPFKVVSALHWLKAQTETTKLYWHDRSEQLEIAGIGVCHEITNVAQSSRFKQATYLGGTAFDPEQQQWNDFLACKFVIPRLEIRKDADGQHLHCHLNCRDNSVEDEVNECLKQLNLLEKETDCYSELLQNSVTNTEHTPDKDQWNLLINNALNTFNPTFKKVVLSRRTKLECAQDIPFWDLLYRWQRATPNCYQFAFQFSEQSAFIGCSPERLFARDGRKITSEAVAGTVLRGGSKSQDLALAESLLFDPKLRLENDLVRKFLEPILTKLCEDVSIDKMTILKLKHIQHLKKSIQGLLHRDVSDTMLFNELHPTPAVGGFPKDKAIEFINNFETYDRGWYSGAVGLLGEQQSEFCVAIRSALIKRNQLNVFAGAGIVEGSVAELEWQELDNKINTLLSLL